MPLEVHPDDGVPLVLGRVDQHPVADEAGVVDQDVQPAEGVDRLPHHGLGLREVGDVGAVGHGLAAECLDLGDHLVGGRVSFSTGQRDAEVVHHDPGALAGQLERMRPTDPRPAPVTIAIRPSSKAQVLLVLGVVR